MVAKLSMKAALQHDRRGRCTRSPSVAGPFPYMKGPLYFLSRLVALRMVRELHHLYLAAVDSGGERNHPHRLESGRPMTAVWEDVWVGYALSQLQPAPELDVVYMDWAAYWENWGFAIRDVSLLWHAKVKDPLRPLMLQRYMEKHHCHRARPVPLQSKCVKAGYSCHNGGVWRLCFDSNDPKQTLCNQTEIDLKGLVRKGLLNTTWSS